MVLKQYDWPGNIRELFHALEYSFATAQDSDTVYPVHLPPEIRIKVTHKALADRPERRAAVHPEDPGGEVELSQDLQSYRDKAIEAAEIKYLRRLVAFTGGDLKQCLQISGLSRSRFYALLKKYNVSLQVYKYS